LRDNSPWIRQEVLSEGITVDYFTSVRGNNTFKATGTLPFPAWLIFNSLLDPEIRKNYSKNEEIFRQIQKECTNTLTVYQRSKRVGIWPITVEPRDFVCTSHYEVLRDGTISICSYGDPQKQHLVPESKAAIRGNLIIAGWSLTPAANNTTNCCLMTEIDLKGALSAKILRFANKK
jgi:hypothetical protein